MDPLLNLTNEELKQIYSLSKPFSQRVNNIIGQTHISAGTDDLTALYVLRDEAYGHYWARKIRQSDILTEELVGELLSKTEFPTAHSLLGGGIIDDKISTLLCKNIMEVLDDDSWLCRQAQAYVLITGTSEDFVISNIEELLKTRCPWALYRVVEKYGKEFLETFSDHLEKSEWVYKREKNRINNRIKQRVKREFR